MKIHKNDNVRIDLKTGHKHAICAIRIGENVIKYGYSIGHATQDIACGELVHTHNLRTNLSENLQYSYEPIDMPVLHTSSAETFT